MNTSDIILV